MEKRVNSVSDAKSEVFPWGQITWIHNGELGNAEELTFGEVIINPGQSNPYHSHSNCEEVLYLLQGELEHTYGDDACYRLEPGMSICVPRCVKHNATCVSDEPAVMVVAYSSAFREVAGE